jgi:hypothetical protein
MTIWQYNNSPETDVWNNYTNQIPPFCETKQTDPKSYVQVGRAKWGQGTLEETDKQTMQHNGESRRKPDSHV